MMYWGDWFLYLRTEEEFKQLADHMPGDKISVLYDNTGSQMFLHIQKQNNI